jgi:hypothetical protein
VAGGRLRLDIGQQLQGPTGKAIKSEEVLKIFDKMPGGLGVFVRLSAAEGLEGKMQFRPYLFPWKRESTQEYPCRLDFGR